jgi:predicted P-loop ATPase
MSAMSKGETTHLKAFVTRTVEKYRPPYGRKEVSQPRQCVFIGTTNNSTYLRDETGGRRFWPVKIGTIDVKALHHERDQLFAEAVRRYLDGEKWHPDAKFEKEHIYPEQDDRFEPDAWEAPILDYLQESKSQKIYLGEIFQHALEIEVTGRDRTKQNRVTAILTRHKWVRLKKKTPKVTFRGVPPIPPKPDETVCGRSDAASRGADRLRLYPRSARTKSTT